MGRGGGGARGGVAGGSEVGAGPRKTRVRQRAAGRAVHFDWTERTRAGRTRVVLAAQGLCSKGSKATSNNEQRPGSCRTRVVLAAQGLCLEGKRQVERKYWRRKMSRRPHPCCTRGPGAGASRARMCPWNQRGRAPRASCTCCSSCKTKTKATKCMGWQDGGRGVVYLLLFLREHKSKSSCNNQNLH